VPLEPAPPEGEVVPLSVLGEVEVDGADEPAGEGTFAVGEPVATGVVVGATIACGAPVATVTAVACVDVEAAATAAELRETVGAPAVAGRRLRAEDGLPIGGASPSCRSRAAGLSAGAGAQALVLVRLLASRPSKNAAPNTASARTTITGAARRSPSGPLRE
jgi:hypothetical protein